MHGTSTVRKSRRRISLVRGTSGIVLLLVIGFILYVYWGMKPHIVPLKLSEKEMQNRIRIHIRMFLPEIDLTFLPGSGRAARWQSFRDPIIYYKVKVEKSDALFLQESLPTAIKNRGFELKDKYELTTVKKVTGAPRIGLCPEWWGADGRGIWILMKDRYGESRSYCIYESGVVLFEKG